MEPLTSACGILCRGARGRDEVPWVAGGAVVAHAVLGSGTRDKLVLVGSALVAI